MQTNRKALSSRDLITLSETIVPGGLKAVRDCLNDNSAALVSQVAAPKAIAKTRAEGRDRGGTREAAHDVPELLAAEVLEAETAFLPSTALRQGGEALGMLEEHGEAAAPSDEQAFAFEALVRLTGRPAILIQEGAFFPAPAEWRAPLEGRRPEIERSFLSVGRIELRGHSEFDWVGTGFLVGEDVVMTNRHVAREFTQPRRGGFEIAGEIEAFIDFKEEFGGAASAEFRITDVIGIHDSLDMALFRVEGTDAGDVQFPKPLNIAGEPPAADLTGRDLYVVGYPAWDGRRNDPEPMMRIFNNIFNVKRLQPGKATGVDTGRSLFTHDCSTLGGNSGSGVFDLDTQQVVGLHFGGRFRQANFAVALWTLQNDPLLRDAGINWV